MAGVRKIMRASRARLRAQTSSPRVLRARARGELERSRQGDFPGARLPRVEDLDPERSELLAEGVGAREVFRLPRFGALDDLRVDRGGVETTQAEPAGLRSRP